MNKFLPVIAIIFLFAVSAFAQDKNPTPKPTPIPDNDVVKISTNLIQVDVSVTDSKGRIVTDLKPDEIEIYENGEKQAITNFSFVSSVKEVAQKRPPGEKVDKNAIPAPLAPSEMSPEKVRRTIAIVIDDLTLSFQSTYYVRKALKKFVDEQMQDGDLVAIVRTGIGIGTLQQFTTDKRQLYAIIDRLRWNPNSINGTSDFVPTGSDISGSKTTSANPMDPDESEPDGGGAFRKSFFQTGTLGALGYVVDGMRELPGRKSILLISGSLPITMFKDGPGHGFTDSGTILNSIYKLVDKANRAAVVIDTMDARGLVTTFFTAEDNTRGIRSRDMGAIISARDDAVLDDQQGLSYLAQQTGGIAIQNDNDLSRGIRKILDDQSYYLVGYQPDSDTFDPKVHRYNQLVVKVTRPGLKVRYRSGFIGQTDEQMEAGKPPAAQRLASALTSPFGVGEISLRLNALFTNDAKQGSFIRSLVYIDTKDLKFSDSPDGTKRALLDLMAIAYGDNGVPVGGSKSTYTVKLTPQQYEQFMRDGIVYDFSFPIKRPGPYQMRFVLMDRESQKIGSANQFIEIPDLKANRLTLSGVFVENLTLDQWTKRNSMSDADAVAAVRTNPIGDTSLRRFRRGTVLNYGFVVFNAKLDGSHQPRATSTIRMFCDGKLVFEGTPKQLLLDGETDRQRINAGGSLSLGKDMQAGDYVLQIVVKDELASSKKQVSTQFIQFELID